MRLTIVILVAIFGLILCVNLSASTYISWQRYRYERSVGAVEYATAQRQRAFDNCVKLSLAYPRKDGFPYPYTDSWASLFKLCETYRQAISP